ncbi:hypothetical protein DB346_21415 [Verrucomicrobia bacterium LW23]|nr:hypothetical protein DB346_21415 [Verrucomicrobia bacterium LW23]
MRAGLKQIAAEAELSINTVSDILNRDRHHLYKPETVERVRQVAKKQNYRPNRSAQSMRSHSTRVIGFVAWNYTADGKIANYVVLPFIIGLSHALIRHNYHLSMVEIHEVELKSDGSLPPALQEHFFDGLVVQHGPMTMRNLWTPQIETPILWWDSGRFDALNNLHRDELAISRDLTQRLIALGHRRIAFLWGPIAWELYQRAMGNAQGGDEPDDGIPLHFSAIHRYHGYCQTMLASGLKPMHVIGYDPDVAWRQFAELRPSAILTQSGMLDPGLAYKLASDGVRIPEDLTIASFDVDTRMEVATIKMGGMSYDRYEAGKTAGAMMLKMLADPEKKTESMVLGGSFIQGATIGSASV